MTTQRIKEENKQVDEGTSLWSETYYRLSHNRLALFGGVIVLITILIAVFAPLLAPFDPAEQHYDAILSPPGGNYLLGTDSLGRDTLSRLMYGARVSLSVGLFTQIIILAIGIPIGVTAGFFGGRIDNILMRLTDITYAFPDLLLIILFKFILGDSIFMIFLAIGIVAWANVARLMRGQILSLKEQQFVTAARAIGAGNLHIILRHLLPNSLGPLIVVITFSIPRAIFAEAALSYIGIGVKPPLASWGTMIQEGTKVIFSTPYATLFPALAIAVIMISFSFLGDGLRDALDPRMHRD